MQIYRILFLYWNVKILSPHTEWHKRSIVISEHWIWGTQWLRFSRFVAGLILVLKCEVFQSVKWFGLLMESSCFLNVCPHFLLTLSTGTWVWKYTQTFIKICRKTHLGPSLLRFSVIVYNLLYCGLFMQRCDEMCTCIYYIVKYLVLHKFRNMRGCQCKIKLLLLLDFLQLQLFKHENMLIDMTQR